MSSNEGPSTNGASHVFVRDPDPDHADRLIPMGMQLQPGTRISEDVNVQGHIIVSKKEGGLSDQATLRLGDMLVAIDGHFINGTPIAEVLTLFERRTETFTMTLVRRNEDATGDIPKYQSRKIEIRIVDDATAEVIFDVSQPLFIYRQSIIMEIRQDEPFTRYFKAFDDETLILETQHVEDDVSLYSFIVNLYQPYTSAEKDACTFYNEKLKRYVTVNEDQGIGLTRMGVITMRKKKDLVEPNKDFFYYESTHIPTQFGFESVVMKGDMYITANPVRSDLKLTQQKPKALDTGSLFYMTHPDKVKMRSTSIGQILAPGTRYDAWGIAV